MNALTFLHGGKESADGGEENIARVRVYLEGKHSHKKKNRKYDCIKKFKLCMVDLLYIVDYTCHRQQNHCEEGNF